MTEAVCALQNPDREFDSRPSATSPGGVPFWCHLYLRSSDPDVRLIAALKTRLWVAQGGLAEALEWARERGPSVHDDLSYLREFEHITLARVLIAQYRSNGAESSVRDALALLGRLQKAAEDGGRLGSLIEILALQALPHAALGEISRALTPLERALALAEPEGYVRVFVDEGEAMRTLLRHAAARGHWDEEPGDRRPSVHQPDHREASHRQRLRQAGRLSPH